MAPTACGAAPNNRPTINLAPQNVGSLGAAHAALRAEALGQMGGPEVSAGRATMLYEIYRDSQGNHVAPLIALHMMLWDESFFAVDGHLGTVLQYRYCYDAHERAWRLTMLQGFADSLDRINRQLCARIYADYHVTKRHGADPEAQAAIPGALCLALGAMHEHTRAGDRLAPPMAKEVFMQSWRHTQEGVMAPLRAVVARLACPILRALIVQPTVHLAYFPAHTRLVYRDFADTAERTARAVQAYDLAEACGWEAVSATLHAYGVLPPSFFRSLSTSPSPPTDCPMIA